MKKTILLGEKGMISSKTSAWLGIFLGLMWIILGSMEIYQEGVSVGSSGYLIMGLLFTFYSLLVFTANPFAPKVIISDIEIYIKKKVFGGSTKILWTNIKSIDFDQYSIAFNLSDSVKEFNYSTNAETSIEIKSAIQEVAEHKDIQINGG